MPTSSSSRDERLQTNSFARTSHQLDLRNNPEMMRRILLSIALLLCSVSFASAQSRVTEARILANSGQLDQARTMLEEELAKNPRDTKGRIAYGTVLHALKRHDDARRELRQVIRASGNTEAITALANVESSTGNLCEAERLTRGWRSRKSLDLNLLVTRMGILRTLRQTPEARDVANTILAADPLNSEASTALQQSEVESQSERSARPTCRDGVVRRLWTKLFCRPH